MCVAAGEERHIILYYAVVHRHRNFIAVEQRVPFFGILHEADERGPPRPVAGACGLFQPGAAQEPTSLVDDALVAGDAGREGAAVRAKPRVLRREQRSLLAPVRRGAAAGQT